MKFKPMKRLILIQNDVAGTGKSTLTGSITAFLASRNVPHQAALLLDEDNPMAEMAVFSAQRMQVDTFIDWVSQQPISILEIDTGLAEFFGHFYEEYDLGTRLAEAGISLGVVIPIGAETESYQAVLHAAEVYADQVEYTVAHLANSSYEDTARAWDRSQAARMMDLLDSVELYLPEIGFQLEMELRSHHMDIQEALAEPDAAEILGSDYARWQHRTMEQIETVRHYLFGDSVQIPLQLRKKTATRKAARML
jgi:hypothetical protein